MGCTAAECKRTIHGPSGCAFHCIVRVNKYTHFSSLCNNQWTRKNNNVCE